MFFIYLFLSQVSQMERKKGFPSFRVFACELQEISCLLKRYLLIELKDYHFIQINPFAFVAGPVVSELW